MLELVWKDVVAARRLLWLVIPLGGVQIAVVSFVPPIYVTAALIFSVLLAFGSIAVEESQRTELLWNSLPLSRGQFVAARYLTTLIGIVAGLAFSWALAQTVTRLASSVADGQATLLSLTPTRFCSRSWSSARRSTCPSTSASAPAAACCTSRRSPSPG